MQCCRSGSGIRCLFDPWIRDPGWVKNQDPGSGSGMIILDHISESLERIFWVKNSMWMLIRIQDLVFFNPGSGIRVFLPWIQDGKNSDPGSGINIPSATLIICNCTKISSTHVCALCRSFWWNSSPSRTCISRTEALTLPDSNYHLSLVNPSSENSRWAGPKSFILSSETFR